MGLLLAMALWVHTATQPSICTLGAQDAPFSKEVAEFEAKDRQNRPAKGQILFIGSSSFTKWTDVGSYFPNHKVLNRAFGGSRLLDVIHFVDKVVFSYEPKQIVIYCGENDLAADSHIDGREVAHRFDLLFKAIRSKIPNVPIAYVSMKPSPSRWNLRDKFIEGNQLISSTISHQKLAAFINVWPAMLGADGTPKPEIFLGDRLHMNATGYHIWQPIIEPFLIKE